MQFRRALNHFLGRDAAANADPTLVARDPAITVISVVFSTAPKTFTGDAVYVTLTGPKATTTANSDDDDDSATTSKKTSATATPNSSSNSAKSTGSSSSSSPTSTAASSTSVNSATQASITASNTPLATAAPSSGMSGGAKAGLAFGLIILFALIGAGVFFFLKKRKRDTEGMSADDEKAFFAAGRNPDSLPAHTTANTSTSRLSSGGFGARSYNEKSMPPPPAGAAHDSSDRQARFSYEEVPAPHLSFRGVSHFGPMGDLSNGSTRMSSVSAMSGASSQALPPAGAAALAAAGGLGGAAIANRNRSNTANNNDPANPFGVHAEKVGTSPSQDVPMPLSPGLNGRKSPAPQAADFPLPDSTPVTPVASNPSSPQMSKAEIATGATVGAAAIAAATAAAASNTPQGGAASENVYRVQLDFKPSMDDELDIAAGQLVRCLHEYDDGWALCIRMDRSKQGVVPRTCLSKHPVKPRPASPSNRAPRGPPPPGMRGPPGPPSGRNSPAPGSRAMSPAPYAASSRPLTPTQGRDRAGSNAPYSQSPTMRAQSPGPHGGSRLGPQGRSRAESNAQSSGLRNAQTPSSSSPTPVSNQPIVARKPVGGS